MRLKSILSKDPGQNTQLTRQYQYSPAGNITEKQTGHGSYSYQYDKLYRLIHAENPTQNDESYTYDLLGNRLTSSTTGTWNYNANNELLGYDTISFSYDANGNTIQKNDNGIITDYSYDIEDRLVEVTTHNPQPTTYRYHYDPFGRRLWKEVDGTRTYFVYSDEGPVGEYDPAGQEIRTYGWIPGSRWSTDPLFVKIEEGVYYWYRNDHPGAPQKIVTTSGAIVWEAVYDSFGSCQIQVEAITNNLRFPGQYYDSETDLCYNLNRYYDPTTGRYLRADPFGPGLNLYVYCFNNPLGLIDQEGLCAVRFVGGMVRGAARAAFQMFVYQPLAMVYDLEQIAYALISGDLGSFTP